MSETAALLVIGLLALQNAAQLWWINKLINKMMSRNWHDYNFSGQPLMDKKKGDNIEAAAELGGFAEDPNAVVL